MLVFFTLYRFYGLLKRQGEKGWATTVKTGPNDTRHIVWALGKSFFSFMFLYTNSLKKSTNIYECHNHNHLTCPTTTEMRAMT